VPEEKPEQETPVLAKPALSVLLSALVSRAMDWVRRKWGILAFCVFLAMLIFQWTLPGKRAAVEVQSAGEYLRQAKLEMREAYCRAEAGQVRSEIQALKRARWNLENLAYFHPDAPEERAGRMLLGKAVLRRSQIDPAAPRRDYMVAEAAFRTASKVRGARRPVIAYYLARIAEQTGKPQDALEGYLQLVALAQSRDYAELAVERGDSSRPAADVWSLSAEEAEELHLSDLPFEIARLYESLGQKPEAMRYYLDYCARPGPGMRRYEARLRLGLLSEELGRPKEAGEHYARLIEMAPPPPLSKEAHFRAGMVRFGLKEWDKALEDFAEARGEYPFDEFDGPAKLMKGRTFLAKGQEAAGRKELREAAEEFATSEVGPAARLWLADALLEIGKWDEAEAELTALAEMPKALVAKNRYFAPGDAIERLGKIADYFRDLKKFDRAIAIHRHLMANYAVEADTYHFLVADELTRKARLAADAERADSLAAAAREYWSIVEESPGSPVVGDAAFRAAEEFFEAGRYLEAYGAYEEFYKLFASQDPRAGCARYYQALCAIELGNWAEAERLLRNEIIERPDNIFAYLSALALGKLRLKWGDYQEALEIFQTLLASNAVTPESAVWRGALFALGQAHYAASRALLAPAQDEPLSKEARRREAARHAAEAIRRLEEALERFPLGEIRPSTPQPQVEELKADRLEATFTLGCAYMDAGEPAKARKYFAEIVSAEPAPAALALPLKAPAAERRFLAHVYLGQCLFQEGKYREARESYTTALDRYILRSEAPWIRWQIGRCYVGEGKSDLARHWFRRAAVAYKNLPEGKKDPYETELLAGYENFWSDRGTAALQDAEWRAP